MGTPIVDEMLLSDTNLAYLHSIWAPIKKRERTFLHFVAKMTGLDIRVCLRPVTKFCVNQIIDEEPELFDEEVVRARRNQSPL